MSAFYFKEHLQKGRAYVEALEGRGHVRTDDLKSADFAFFDHDISWSRKEHRPEVYICEQMKIPFFIYPHAARPGVLWDINKPWEKTTCQFTQANGGKQILKMLDYPCPVEVTGWTYSEIKRFRPSKPNGKIKVLFAPIHPMGNGYLHLPDLELNKKAYKLLSDCIDEIDLTIRYIKTLRQNNIRNVNPEIKCVRGEPDNSTKEIEEADLVISAFTHAYISVALGKPTIMFGESVPPHSGTKPENLKWGTHWDIYKDYMKYPYNLEDVFEDKNGFYVLAEKAMKPNKDVISWKRKFIGKPFDPNYFVDKVEAYL